MEIGQELPPAVAKRSVWLKVVVDNRDAVIIPETLDHVVRSRNGGAERQFGIRARVGRPVDYPDHFS